MTSPLVSCLIAAALAARGYRRRSLSAAGAAAAFVVGYVHWNCGTRFGLPLILFYLSSSKLTTWRSDRKAELEAEHRKGGQRTPVQVFANSAGGLLLALAARHGAPRLWPSSPQVAAFLLAAFLGHYSSCAADTWASEVGIVSRRPPRLITDWRVVRPGTNGGVSALGTAAGFAGGAFMGVAAWALEIATPGAIPGAAGGEAAFGSWNLALGLLGGALGNVLDSLLGATLQFSGADAEKGRATSRPGPGVQHISGRDVLSNDAVNALAAAAAATLTGVAGLWLTERVP